MIDDEDRRQMEDFEARRWEEEGWKRGREDHIKRLKSQVSSLITRRIETYQWAESMIPFVEQAHYEARDELMRGEALSGPKMAASLAAQGVITRKKVELNKLADRGKAFANALMHETDAGMIWSAVEECRTIMTSRALRADFDSETVGSLEAEYIEIVADAMALGRRLRNQPGLGRDALLTAAKGEAINVANAQRREKPPVTMAARERYWRDRKPPIKKVFEA